LLRYIKPVSRTAENTPDIGSNDADEEFTKSLKQHFLRNNRNKFIEITKALEIGDVKLAHRLVHTLKSNAGQFGAVSLQKAASDAEMSLKEEKNQITAEQLKILEIELSSFLFFLSNIFSEADEMPGSLKQRVEKLEPEEIRELLEKLEPLLKAGNPDCVKYKNDLYGIPESELLIQQIDDFEFEAAGLTLTELKESKGF
jgi:HPt (histidine-containing phosphotransfer) domain-containing protein